MPNKKKKIGIKCNKIFLFMPVLLSVYNYLPWNQCINYLVFFQEADGDDKLAFPGEGEGEMEGDSKADTPDVPPSTDNTPQCLNKALEGLSSRYPMTLSSWATPQTIYVGIMSLYGCLGPTWATTSLWCITNRLNLFSLGK